MLRTPAVRFTAQAYSFLIFLTAIAAWSLDYEPGSVVKLDFRGQNVSHLFKDHDGGYLIREYKLDGFEIIIFVWTLGKW